jgi:RimJ/RimL family protein N-acetyltransferase
MKSHNLKIDIVENDAIKLVLRTAKLSDIENLRRWKNREKEYFFYKKEISEEQQKEWFNNYLIRSNDFIFILELNDLTPIGCMGIRRLENEWDAYNIILGESAYGNKGYISRGFQTMLDFAIKEENLPITLKVLKQNPAVTWYEKNGFQKMSDDGDHFYMKYIY